MSLNHAINEVKKYTTKHWFYSTNLNLPELLEKTFGCDVYVNQTDIVNHEDMAFISEDGGIEGMLFASQNVKLKDMYDTIKRLELNGFRIVETFITKP